MTTAIQTPVKAPMTLQPLADRVVVEPIEEGDISLGGILMPETAKEKPQRGIVLAVGTGRYDDKGVRIAMTVKIADKVLYTKYGGNEIKLNGSKVLILKESDILAIIES